MLGMVLAETFNPYTLGVALVLFAVIVVLVRTGRPLRIRTGHVEVNSGTLEQVAHNVEQVARQINHVDDPDAEPTMREMVCTMHQQLVEMRGEVAGMRRDINRLDRRSSSVEAAQYAQSERLGEVGRLARQTADIVDDIKQHDEADE